MVALTSKLELQSFLWRNFNSQRTCIANSTVLTPIQPKIQASKVSEFAPSCANEYAKGEGEGGGGGEGGEGGGEREEYNNFH